MLKTTKGICRADGAATMAYEAGKEYFGSEDWEVRTLSGFVKRGVAHEIGGNAGPTETKRKRARDAKGKLRADDPSTPDVNEAWEEPTPPKKKRGRPPKVKK